MSVSNCIVTRNFRGTDLFLTAMAPSAKEFVWSADRSNALRMDSDAALRACASHADWSKASPEGRAVVLDPKGHVIGATAYRVKLSEWLTANTDSHAIQDSDALAAKFEADTGVAADWPSHTEAQTVRAIKGRGKGGEIKTGTGKRLCYGYQVAEHFSSKHTTFVPWQSGLGFRYRSAIDALVAAGF